MKVEMKSRRVPPKQLGRRESRASKTNVAVPKKNTAPMPDDITWPEARQTLEEELARLPEESRAAIILCLFKGHSCEIAAQFLGIMPHLVKRRLRRGRGLLENRLTRRGISLAVLGALLSSRRVEAPVSTKLFHSTLRACTAGARKRPR